VISPEGCAAILWRDAKRAPQAAEALKLTATDLQQLGIIDGVLPEPVGGAHRDPAAAADTLSQALRQHLDALGAVPPFDLIERRLQRFRRMGVVEESQASP
jgi:acetyl-CoA carboxylase alpha subunit